MFGAGTEAYFDELPELTALDPAGARRILSSAYADVLAARDGLRRRVSENLQQYVLVCVASRQHSRLMRSCLTIWRSRSARGAAFVAAESLSLLLDLPELLDEDDELAPRPLHRLEEPRGLLSVECGLLYLTAGFDSNAAVAARSASAIQSPATQGWEPFWAERAYRALIATLQLFPNSPIVLRQVPQDVPEASEWPDERVRGELYRRLETAATDYLRWLSFEDQIEDEAPAERLRSLAELLRGQPSPRYAAVAHLVVLLQAAIESTSARALRRVPAPESDTYNEYIQVRASERPLVWPSTAQYAEACLPGPSKNAVVALPTGSGKSFTAELAAAQALAGGWVLYLVPTNALAAQVRRDLTRDLGSLQGTRIRAFFGDGQYTELGEEAIADVGAGDVVVMTPEKCALALRRAPDAFLNLRLCVFDECHQIREAEGRGAIAELVLSHLMTLAPESRFLLMSALLSNAAKVADWLAAVTDRPSEAISSPWRPTRTLRAIVGFDVAASQEASRTAKQTLAAAAPHRKNLKYASSYAVLANLQGAWSRCLGRELRCNDSTY